MATGHLKEGLGLKGLGFRATYHKFQLMEPLKETLERHLHTKVPTLSPQTSKQHRKLDPLKALNPKGPTHAEDGDAHGAGDVEHALSRGVQSFLLQLEGSCRA